MSQTDCKVTTNAGFCLTSGHLMKYTSKQSNVDKGYSADLRGKLENLFLIKRYIANVFESKKHLTLMVS